MSLCLADISGNFTPINEFFASLLNLFVLLAPSMLTTLEIFLLTLIFSLPLGIIVALARMSKFAPLSFITKVYISIMRGTPLMLQLLVVYYGPYFLFGIRISESYRLTAVIIGFVLNYAAYFAEIYRSGIQSTPLGQYEAADVLGFKRTQTFTLIVLPQVVKKVLPPITNEVITLVKDTSLAYSIVVIEMFTKAKMIAASTTSMLPYIAAGIFYFIFNYIVAFIMERFEKKLSYYH